ncbi:MAG: beta-ketoacyl-[acyl-carrier-protein] synthase family protein [Opitutaceae bacterium]|jgi:3-oxoacyl-[acyl-carrier-protein] synthase-1|nr:beta-ketoacyl-[acyl-carrier-protein] synthase family protein [Opitutaceae bacterium]
MPKVFVTGLGFITSIGNDRATVSRSLRELNHGMQLYPPFQKPEVPVKVAAPIRDFNVESADPEDWTFPSAYRIRRDVLRSLSPNSLFAYCAMQQAIKDAALNDGDISNEETGLYAASGGSPHLLARLVNQMHAQGVMRCPPLGIVASIAGTVQFNLVAHFKIRGASTGFSSACASSSHAMGFAYDEIVLGRQSRMFVIGAEDGNVETILPFAGMRALSANVDPATASRPFDVARDGFVGTGGAAVLVLESEDEVRRRGVTPYCEVAGWGQASDGHNVAISHPEGTGLRIAMERALRSCGLRVQDIDYVNAHATSTPIGDLSEVKALKAVLGPEAARVAVSSTKALTGHGLSLAGAMESGFCALALREGFIPGSAHITQLDPACAGMNIPRTTETASCRVMLNNSSGFGGANVCVVLRRA